MATSGPTNLPAFFNVDADFRSWCQGINAGLAAIGLTNTADTGQINNTTVSKPGSTNTAQGYEIWKFADSIQATSPIFLKIEYGSGGAADRPSIWLTVGSGSNGSGTLTGQLDSRTQITSSASKTAGVVLPSYFSGSTGEIFLALNIDTASNSYGIFAGVERLKDSTNTATSEGVLVSRMGGGTCTAIFLPNTGTVPSQVSQGWGAVAPALWSRSASGANADACPVLIPIGGVWRYSHILLSGAGDFTAGGTLSTTILGGSHTFLTLDRVFGTTNTSYAVSSGVSFIWE